MVKQRIARPWAVAMGAVVIVAATGAAYFLSLAPPNRLPVATAESIVAATKGPTASELAQGVVDGKVAALQADDLEAYMTLIDDGDPEYTTEQRNWFLLTRDAKTSEFSIEVLDADFAGDGVIVAKVRQHYLLGSEKEDRDIEYEQRFIETDAGWKDADLNFSLRETAHFVIKYPADAAEKAVEVGEAAEEAYSSVRDTLELELPAKPTIKMYATKEMLRESTDIRIAYLFNGWGEAGESIKMYAYRSGNLPILIAHELVHKVTLEITSSQPSWFAEGLATYFGNWPLAGGNALQMGTSTLEDLTQPISWLEGRDLTQIEDDQTRRTFYDMSGMIVQFVVETHGLERLQAVLNEMAQFPEPGRGYDYSMEPKLQDQLYQSIETVIGLDRAAFNEAWLEWIAAQ